MDLNEYQEQAVGTAIYPKKSSDGLVYCSLKLAAEAGEFAEKIGKAIRQIGGSLGLRAYTRLHDGYRDSLVKELGDVLWYVAMLAHELGFTLEHVASVNQRKLASRRERGVIAGDGDER